MGGRFQEALEAHPAPRLIGNLRLRYDASLLMGVMLRPLSWRDFAPEALLVMAFGVALMALVFLFVPGMTVTPAAIAALVCVGCVLGAVRLDAQRATPLRFVLNFADETLTLDASGQGRFKRKRLTTGFDDVVDVEVIQEANGALAIAVEVASADQSANQVWTIAHGIPPVEVEAVRRFSGFLRGAFGL